MTTLAVSGTVDGNGSTGKPSGSRLSSSATSSIPYLIVVLLLPALMLCTYQSVYFQSGYLDPWIYSSLIHNYDDVVDRYAGTYYAARIGHIMPAAFFNWMFGEQGGFFAFRYFMLTLAGLAAFAFGARSYSPAVGLAAAAVAVCTPWLLLPYSSDHYDGTAAVYLLIAYVLTFMPTERKALFHLAAGAALGVSAHVTQLSLGPFAMIVPAWLILHRQHPISRQFLFVSMGLIGLVSAYCFMLFALQLTNPRWAEGDPTFAQIMNMLGGDAARWADPLSLIFTQEYYYAFAPAIAGGFLLAMALGKSAEGSRTKLVAYALLTFLPLAFYYWRALSLHGVMTKNFTLINLFPAGVLGIVVLLGETTRPIGRWARLVICWAITAGLLGSWVVLGWTGTTGLDNALDAQVFLLVGLVIWAALLLAGFLRRPLIPAGIAAVGILFLGLAPYQQDEFAAMKQVRASGIEGWDLKRGVNFFVDRVAQKTPPHRGRLGFWYESTPRMNSLQSAYLWQYSRAFPGESAGMPILDEGTRTLLKSYGTLMLISEDKTKLDEGYAALTRFAEENGDLLRDVDAGEYRSETWDYYFRTVDRIAPKPPEPQTTPDTIAWADISTMSTYPHWSPARTDFADGKSTVTSHPSPGGFSSQLNLPLTANVSGPARVRVWVRVLQGDFYVLATKFGDSNILYVPATNIPPVAGGGESIFEFVLPDVSLQTSLIFGNASGSGQSVAEIRAVEIVRTGPAAAAAQPGPK